MKTKILLAAALIGVASLSAQAGVRFGFSFGLPLPVIAPAPVVAVAPAPVYVAPPAPVCVAPPVVVAPAPVYVSAPPCPGPGYAWAPGYWSVSAGCGRVWVPGAWRYGGGYYAHYGYGYGYGHPGWRR